MLSSPKCLAVSSHVYNSDIELNTLNLKYTAMKRISIVQCTHCTCSKIFAF